LAKVVGTLENATRGDYGNGPMADHSFQLGIED